VCSSANLDLVRDLGADEVLDYTSDGFALPNAEYDLVFDAVGKLRKSRAKKALKSGGRYANVNSATNDQKFGLEELQLIAGLAEQGALKTVIDRRYAFEDIVEAHRYVDTGRKKGNVIITVGHES